MGGEDFRVQRDGRVPALGQTVDRVPLADFPTGRGTAIAHGGYRDNPQSALQRKRLIRPMTRACAEGLAPHPHARGEPNTRKGP